MNWSTKKVRLRLAWVLVLPFLLLARPTAETIALGAIFAMLGAVVRAWASGTIRKNDVLTTGGPYAHTRNPLYVGTFLMGLGLVIASGTLILVGIFFVVFFVVYGRAMRDEERRLEDLFGDRFRAYAASVPRFIPRIRPYRPPEPHPTRFLLQRYFLHREWEFALGGMAGFLMLIAKMYWF